MLTDWCSSSVNCALLVLQIASDTVLAVMRGFPKITAPL